MTTEQRLEVYYPFFSPEVLETVADIADWQKSLDSYQQFFDEMNVPSLYEIKHDGILDIRPDEHDPDEALVYHLPMANPLDANQVYQAATVAKANPDKRLIALSNPSGLGYSANTLMYEQRKIVKTGDFSPVAEPLVRYLEENNITRANHVGYSYGTETAAAAIIGGQQEVEKAVMIEPASVVERSLGQLGMDFLSTNKELENYVKASDNPAFSEAHRAGVGLIQYSLGLGRLSNIAIARGLARGKFEENMTTALEAQTEMSVTIITGEESELALRSAMHEIVTRMRNRTGVGRVYHLTLRDQKHALANDIYLQAALVLEGLK